MTEAPPMLLSKIVFYVILFVVLLSLVGGGFVIWYKEKYSDKGCLFSILVRDQTNQGDFECSRKVYDIDVENKNYISKIGDRYDKSEIPKAVTMNYMADAMVDCWQQMGEGKYNVFRNEFSTDKQVHCFVCNTFKIPKDVTIRSGELSSLSSTDVFTDKRLSSFKEFLHTNFGSDDSTKRYSDLLKGALFTGLTNGKADEFPFIFSVDYVEPKDKPYSSFIHNYLGLVKERLIPYQTTDLETDSVYSTVYWSVSQEAIKKGLSGTILSNFVNVEKDPSFVFVAKYSDVAEMSKAFDYGPKNKFSCEVMYG